MPSQYVYLPVFCAIAQASIDTNNTETNRIIQKFLSELQNLTTNSTYLEANENSGNSTIDGEYFNETDYLISA